MAKGKSTGKAKGGKKAAEKNAGDQGVYGDDRHVAGEVTGAAHAAEHAKAEAEKR